MRRILSLAAICVATSSLFADQITLVADRDNTLYQSETGSLSNGLGSHLFVGRTAQEDALSRRRALVRFDLSSIPAGSVVTQVTLSLHCSRANQSGPTAVTLHRLLADWGEGASSASGQEGAGTDAETGDATWLHRFYTTQLWTTPGGDFAAAPSASTSVGGEGVYAWSSAQLVADAQAWIDGTAQNHGWLVLGDESEPATAKRWDSRQNESADRRPSLTIVYTARPAGGACCLPDGSCVSVDADACAALGGIHQGDGTECGLVECPVPMGACCLPDATCIETSASECAALGGTYQGDASMCMDIACPLVLEPFVDALPRPAVAAPIAGKAGGEAVYRIEVTQFEQELHRDLPPTTVWGYGGSYPGPTIEARRDAPVTVTWANELRGPDGRLLLEHYLPVDHCMHGPHTEGSTPRLVTHLHGGVVPFEFDGYPEFTILPGQETTYVYPNIQEAGTLWYHDHALGITRLNVYMGLAGFYLLRDDEEDALDLPSGEFEIPLAIQDRSFHPDGRLAYPEMWMEHFFGDVILVNGKVWPYLEVKRGAYRFRVLNGSGSRAYTLALSNGATFRQIGTDVGLLEAPVPLASLTLTPGERADIVIDFARYPAGTELVLLNSAPAPFPGPAGGGVVPNVMKFVVLDEPGHVAPLPSLLRPFEPIPEEEAIAERSFELRTFPEACAGSHWLINGLRWDDVTEVVRLDTTEIWSWVNRSGVTHPMHMHLVAFQILDRQNFVISAGQVVPAGERMPPAPNERGWKDTVQAPPSQITRVIARFVGFEGLFSYHCHILEHEDHEMMRQFRTVPRADLNLDGDVGAADLAILLGAWGQADPIADLDGDGIVGASDLAILLGAWTG